MVPKRISLQALNDYTKALAQGLKLVNT